MGFFGVAPEPNRGTFAAIECHVNLWVLGLLFWRTDFVFDVGLQLRATGDDPVSAIKLAIPFGTVSDSLEDLSDRVRDLRNSGLLFGKPVQLTPTTIDYGAGVLDLLRVLRTSARRDDTASQKDFSVWHLTIEPTLLPGRSAYLRVRFHIANAGRAWIWKRSLLARNGALVDLRVADAREAWNVPDGQALAARLIGIERIRLFVIASWQWQLRSTSPPVHYIRMLEGRAWERYLDRATSLFAAPKLVIYQWRRDNGAALESPFRVFADLSDEFGLVRFGNHIRTAIVTIVLLVSISVWQPGIGAVAGKAIDLWRPLSLTASGALILWLVRNSRPVAKALSLLRKGFLATERRLYHPRRAS
jgi:hypothetical protein